MGCVQSQSPEGQQASALDNAVKEEHIEIALRQKRRARNVFTESIELSPDFHKKVIEKDEETRELIGKALEANFIFASLTPSEKTDFIDAMEEQKVQEGTTIINQGEKGEYFYVVERGSFSFVVDGEAVGSCQAGSCFGELALLYNTPRAASVVAKTEAVVWALDRLTFRYTLANNSAAQKDQIMAVISKVPLLEGLTREQLEKITDAVQLVNFNPGETIIRKGQQGNVFYMIKDGIVEVKDVGANNQFDDHELHPGDYFGERALLLDEPRAANVIALTKVMLLALDREAFDSLLGPLRDVLDYNLSMRVLKSIKLFHKLTEREKDRLAKSFTQERFEAGHAIIRQGDEGDKFYIIKEGTAVVLQAVENDGGNVKEVARLGTGDHFGEMALLNNEVRKATVIAHTEVEVFSVDRTSFNRELGPLQEILDRTQHSRMATLNANEEAAALHANISFADLRATCVLGTGTFGTVKLVQHKETKNVYALKTMMKSQIVAHKQTRNVIQEKNVMMMSNHPFILRLYTTFKDGKRLYLLLEFIQGGELWSVLHGPTRDGVPLEHARFYGACVMDALAYLHSKGIAYRDMKPENCLIDKNGYPKIADFGFAKIIESKTYTLCGTPEYLAPEIVLGRGHTKAVDYWAFGILLYEMIAGYSPFCDPEGNDQMTICKNIVHMQLRFPASFDPVCKDLVKKLLVRDDTRRLGNMANGPQEVLTHSFFETMDYHALENYTVPAPWVPKIKSSTDTSNFDTQEIYDADDDGFRDTSDWDRDF